MFSSEVFQWTRKPLLVCQSPLEISSMRGIGALAPTSAAVYMVLRFGVGTVALVSGAIVLVTCMPKGLLRVLRFGANKPCAEEVYSLRPGTTRSC